MGQVRISRRAAGDDFIMATQIFGGRRRKRAVKGMSRRSDKPFLGVVPFGREAPPWGFNAGGGFPSGRERKRLYKIGGLFEIETAQWVWFFKWKQGFHNVLASCLLIIPLLHFLFFPLTAAGAGTEERRNRGMQKDRRNRAQANVVGEMEKEKNEEWFQERETVGLLLVWSGPVFNSEWHESW
ncbi:unnamed protein product [Linum trigynum]|uniref:Uncharacterized protein n=1 Tax=Linum trigynum TaxID=586398 RepID=A0AAV2DRR6_9ROSI